MQDGWLYATDTEKIGIAAVLLGAGRETKESVIDPAAGIRLLKKAGDPVKKGDVLCIVESMKMFNNIEAELEGTIAAVCVDNGQIVEFGQPLVRILPEKEEN